MIRAKLPKNLYCFVKRLAKHKDILMTSHYSPLLFTKCLKTSDSFPLQQTFCIIMTDISDADAFEGRHIRSETSVSTVWMHLLITL